MHIVRLLVLSLLIPQCVAPVAQLSSADKSLLTQSLPAESHERADSRADQNPPLPLGKLIDVGGYRVHLYCTGAGSPTVVIVGAGFSFDWGLVQPEVAKFTRVCSYDHSGIGWSDTGPKDSCSLRVSEVHKALENAGINGPYVLVGHSLGALVARLYAGRYPDEVAGVVFVDHALMIPLPSPKDLPALLPSKSQLQGIESNPNFSKGIVFADHASITSPPRDAKVPPSPPSSTPQPQGMEIDPNFSKLSPRDRQLHHWAMSQARTQVTLQASLDVMPKCLAETDAITKEHSPALGDKPLVDVSTDMGEQSPDYAKFQTELLSLSLNSKQMVAANSSHFIIIDRPDVVIDAISQVVKSVRSKSKL